ncbi:Hypothetical predicted protein [Octopus vulgaris]|uniref:Uncharacterized protein n=1 Tax=Octopus vulgaris TaxID=6645 RepID=A0AA36FHC0_OCTVU|nr:Hypothetical predicted protein [Octopus vulgaris]
MDTVGAKPQDLWPTGIKLEKLFAHQTKYLVACSSSLHPGFKSHQDQLSFYPSGVNKTKHQSSIRGGIDYSPPCKISGFGPMLETLILPGYRICKGLAEIPLGYFLFLVSSLTCVHVAFHF